MTLTDEQIRKKFAAAVNEKFAWNSLWVLDNPKEVSEQVHAHVYYAFEGFKAALSLQGEAVPVEIKFNYGRPFEIKIGERIVYEYDISPQPYWEVCWAHGWGGCYESKEDAEAESESSCGLIRSIRKMSPEDTGYKNPASYSISTEKFYIPATAQQAEQAEEDAYLIDKLAKLLAEIAIIMKGEELPLHRHSYHDLPELVRALKNEQSELIRKCAELAPEECQRCRGYGKVRDGLNIPIHECQCPICDGSGEQPNKAILALLPEEGKG